MNQATLDRQVGQALEGLRRAFADRHEASEVSAIGEACYETLRARARIPDFIPVLVYRYTREELIQAEREELHRAV
jgi:hypothetical protein